MRRGQCLGMTCQTKPGGRIFLGDYMLRSGDSHRIGRQLTTKYENFLVPDSSLTVRRVFESGCGTESLMSAANTLDRFHPE